MAQQKPITATITVELPNARNVARALDATRILLDRLSEDVDIGLPGGAVIQPRIVGVSTKRPAAR